MAASSQLRLKCGAFDKQVTLTPVQKGVVNKQDPLIVINGATGTGKTVVLFAKGLEWLTAGNDVIVLAIHGGGIPTSRFVFHALSEAREISQGPLFPKDRTWGHVKFEFLHVTSAQSVTQTITTLQKLGQRDLHIIMDNAEPEGDHATILLQDLMLQLKARIPGVHLWAADWCMKTPNGFRAGVLDQPLRFPTPLLFEIFVAIRVMQELNMLPPNMGFSQFDVTSLHPPGPDVIHLRHKGKGLADQWPVHSEECGRKVAKILRKIGVGPAGTASKGGRRSYQYRDVMVLCRNPLDHSQTPAFAQGLEASGIPTKLFGKGNYDSLFEVYDDLVLAKEDKVTIANQAAAIGLDRKVVVCLVGAMIPDEHWQEEGAQAGGGGGSVAAQLKAMMELKHRLSIYTRCTEQLVVVHLPKGIEPGLSGTENYGKSKCTIL